jgi:hypothetical protein
MLNSEIETIWETYDFSVTNMLKYEDEATFYLNSLDEMSLYHKGEGALDISEEEYLEFLEEGLVSLKALISFYNKHLFTIKEIESFDLRLMPPEREVSEETLSELKSLTINLKESMSSAKDLFESIKQSLL